MAIFIESNEIAFNSQFKNFANKISIHGPTLGLLPAEITAIKADSAANDYMITSNVQIQTFAQNYTKFKNILLRGGEDVLGVLPASPIFGTAPPMPAPNIRGRFRALLQRLTHHPAYTAAIGEDLGVEAPAVVNTTPIKIKPDFFIEMSSGGYPNLRWTKGKMDGVEIWKDTGSGFVKLDRDMKPDYIDKSQLPAAGMSAVWRYKMIYIKNDEHIGSWSDTVTVTVYGEV
ncbi:hypothetical protein WSM22_31530 [Cytophagales bacterium WSM2-2]|nr:hypothetical protein WSM22_31530 [Cytophagales bacterium WSM2-2]